MLSYLNTISSMKDKSKDRISVDHDESGISNLNNSVNTHFNISNINVSQINEEDFEEFKKEIDKQIEEKKKKVEALYPLPNIGDFEQKVREELEAKYKLVLKEEKERFKQIRMKKKEELKIKHEIRLDEFKQKIKQEQEEILKNKTEEIKKNFNLNREDIQNEIDCLKITYQKLETGKCKLGNSKNTNDIKEKEEEYHITLNKFESELEKDLNMHIEKIKSENMIKKLEYENSTRNLFLESEKILTDNLIKERKSLIQKSHQIQLQELKENMIKQYEEKLEEEKFEFSKNFEYFVNNLKTNYEQTQIYYEHQKLIYKTELNMDHSTSSIDKIKNIFDSKNSIFKNILDHNYFVLKKKLRDCENINELNSFTNKDIILNKINELLTMLFYGSIYEFLLYDLNDDKEIISNHLDCLISLIEQVISTLNYDKVQLNIIASNTNFNF